jgi:hypothetical protein
MELLSRHKLILATIAIQLVALPLILFAVKQQQETRTQATAATTLSLTPASYTTDLGQSFTMDVDINPANNLVSIVKLDVRYDSTKVKLDEVNPVTVTQSFPQIVEGPIVTNGRVQMSVSIGSDQSKVVQTAAKVVTLNFKSLASTNSTSISFGNVNEVYSIAPQDRSDENVLSSTSPANVKINAAPTVPPTNPPTSIPTIPPTVPPTAIPTVPPTAIPTARPTVPPTNPPTRIPTQGPTNIPTQPPTLGKTVIEIKNLKLHGLGTGGDTPNPNGGGNTNPVRKQRVIEVELYNANGALATVSQGFINFNTTSGDFSGLIEIPHSVPAESYLVKLKTPQYLRRQLPGFIELVHGQKHTPALNALISGDINDDNKLNIQDYDILIGCYSDLLAAKNCPAGMKEKADLTDDGKVNHDDYNLFLRELSVQQGE